MTNPPELFNDDVLELLLALAVPNDVGSFFLITITGCNCFKILQIYFVRVFGQIRRFSVDNVSTHATMRR